MPIADFHVPSPCAGAWCCGVTRVLTPALFVWLLRRTFLAHPFLNFFDITLSQVLVPVSKPNFVTESTNTERRHSFTISRCRGKGGGSPNRP